MYMIFFFVSVNVGSRTKIEAEAPGRERSRSRLMRFTHSAVCKYAAGDENHVSVMGIT